MTENNFFTVLEITQELKIGIATVKFLLRRFEKWLPGSFVDGQTLYDAAVVNKLIRIKEKIDSGRLPSQIEKDLESEFHAPAVENSIQDVRLSNDSIHLMKSLFNEIGMQQERIANAHEKRAAAEERKAVAIEKRAQAEEKKAQAMNNIAAALQEMNRLRSHDFDNQQIVGEAAKVLISDELSDTDHEEHASIADQDPLTETESVEDLSHLLDDIESEPIDNLSDIIEDTEHISELDEIPDLADDPDAVLDDLSILMEDPLDELNELSDLIEDHSGDDIDDLSLLIDDPNEVDIDTLSFSDDEVDEVTSNLFQEEIDDLSKLIESSEDAVSIVTHEMDDLSLLIESQDSVEIDDLSLLIEDDIYQNEGELLPQIDDLSELINDVTDSGPAIIHEMDDLSKLIESDDQPSIKPDIRPQENLEKYKAEIINIIMQLKNDGFSVEETAQRFNKEGVQTLSGKDQWSVKAIAQVYKFIDSAKK